MPESTATSGAVTLDDLIAMNDEVASFLRAGIPLELGLGQLAVNAPRGLADLSGRLAQRLGNGQSLNEALDAEAGNLPRVYRAVIAAGMRAGRLSAAMEAVADLSRTVQEVRRRITLSLIYPGLVILTAYYLFWFFVGRMFPVAMELTVKPHEAPTGWLAAMWSLHRGVVAAGHIPPAIVGVLVVWWVIAGRYFSPAGGIAGAGIRWLPGIRGSLRRFHLASFSELSAVLMEHDVPTADALQLAAESTGDAAIIRDANELSAACRRGEPLSKAISRTEALPGFMQWMIAAGERESGLPAAFRQLAVIYRKRAVAGADRFKLWFPIIVTVALGGLVAVAYTLSLFVPLAELLKTLSQP